MECLLGRIVAATGPAAVILFGSRARGEATEWSDWDLMVLVGDDAPEEWFDPFFGWNLQSGSGVYADVFIVLASEFETSAKVVNTLQSEIVRSGGIELLDPRWSGRASKGDES